MVSPSSPSTPNAIIPARAAFASAQPLLAKTHARVSARAAMATTKASFESFLP